MHPSEVEGLPIAVLDAMAHARTVVVSDIPENREAVGDAGVTFPLGDTAALTATLTMLLESPERVRELGARARERAGLHYDWDTIALQTEATYLEIASPRGAR